MNAPLRKLPIDIQTFEKIRRGGYVYVDKTVLIYRLVMMGKPYFLSRPPCFGKNLLISTLEAYFEGRRDLFEGLAIAELEQEWQVYPVLRLDLNAGQYDTPEQLGMILNRHLDQWEDQWDVKYPKIHFQSVFPALSAVHTNRQDNRWLFWSMIMKNLCCRLYKMSLCWMNTDVH